MTVVPGRGGRLLVGVGLAPLVIGLVSACQPSPPKTLSPLDLARQRISHVVIVMQENRSFDHYFGTFPGAEGIPMQNGVPTVCAVDPRSGACVAPYHDTADRNLGGPHGSGDATADINGGRMNGFIRRQVVGLLRGCRNTNDPNCGASGPTPMPDVMGYHDQNEIPNYWAYARNFVLQDHLFESAASWSLPAHLFLVSEWSAKCLSPDPMSCRNELQGPVRAKNDGSIAPYAWTDLTYLLHVHNVSWSYYLDEGSAPDCPDDEMTCPEEQQKTGVPSIWNPLPGFATVHENGELDRIRSIDDFFIAAQNGALPAVSWIMPNGKHSEHPPALVSEGQAYVTRIVNALMESPQWSSTTIFVTWDDWGGFYDHVVPPSVDANGYGLRVPGLVIGPYVRAGFTDHQTLSFDAYAKFIEDLFLNGERLDPMTDGRPDSRPDVREDSAQLGNLLADFDFSQPPRAPLVLPAP
jgi:phospholipase C